MLTCMGKLRFEENLIAEDTIWTPCGSLAGRGTKYPERIAKASVSKLYSAKSKCFPVTSLSLGFNAVSSWTGNSFLLFKDVHIL